MSTTEENKVVVQRLIEEVYNQGNLDLLDELLSPNMVEDHPLPLDSRIDSEIILCPAINFRREKLALVG